MPSDSERYDDPDWSLWSELALASDWWRDVYAEYWGLVESGPEEPWQEDEGARARKLDELAPRLMRAALAMKLSAMKPSEGPLPELSNNGRDFARALLEAFGESILVRDRWSFEVAEDAFGRLKGSEERITRLLSLVLFHDLNEIAAAYISRVSRLYVYGFEVEALIMCRSTLEAALQDVVTDERLQASGLQRRGPEYTLAQRVSAAKRFGHFTEEERKAAWGLKEAANQAIHTAPGFLEEGITGAFEAIQLLLRLLEALFRKGT